MKQASPRHFRPGCFVRRNRWAMLALQMFVAAVTHAAEGDAPATALPPAASLVAANAAPLRAVRVFRVYGWRGLDARNGVIWLGVDEPYVIRLSADCRVADKAMPSALALRDAHLVPGRDRLLFPSGGCTIDSVARADRARLRASSISSVPASAVRLIQEAAPRKSR